MSDELKLCPFCGDEAIPEYYDAWETWFILHSHGDTECIGSTFKGFKTEEELIEAWNRRAK